MRHHVFACALALAVAGAGACEKKTKRSSISVLSRDAGGSSPAVLDARVETTGPSDVRYADAPVDAAPPSDVRYPDTPADGPHPTCAFQLSLAPNASCGELPPVFANGCGCTDGVPAPKCVDGVWVCEYGLQPRALCSFCSGPTPAPELDARPRDVSYPDLPADGPTPSCASGQPPYPPDARCGPLPAVFAHGCGCTDGIAAPKCVDGVWICEYDKQPRALCRDCGGPDMGRFD